jgi:hypothetical protein
MLRDMKIIIAIICFLSMIGCNEKSVDIIGDSASEIDGQFINWNSSYRDSLFWNVSIDSVEHLLAFTKISNDGHFSLNLPTPPSQSLGKYSKYELEDSIYFKMTDSIVFSDTNAKYISLSLSHYDVVTLPIRCGNTNYFSSNSKIGDYQIHYYYFDRPTEVKGNWTVQLKGQIYPGYERNIVTIYNKVNFNRGWNQIIIKLISTDNDKRIFEVTNESRSSTEWLLIALPNEFVRVL